MTSAVFEPRRTGGAATFAVRRRSTLVVAGLPAASSTAIAGDAVGYGQATGAIRLRQPIAGGAVGAGSAAGALTLRQTIAGAAVGLGAATGDVRKADGVSGAAVGVGSATGAVTLRQSIAGGAVGTGAAAGAMTLRQSIAGDAVGTGSATGAVAPPASGGEVSGDALGAGIATGDVRLRQTIAGDAVGTGSATGAVALRQSIAGAAVGTGSATGAVDRRQSIAGDAVGAGAAVGAVRLRQWVSGAAVGAGAATGALTLRQSISGAAVGIGSATGAVEPPSGESADWEFDPNDAGSLTLSGAAVLDWANLGASAFSLAPNGSINNHAEYNAGGGADDDFISCNSATRDRLYASGIDEPIDGKTLIFVLKSFGGNAKTLFDFHGADGSQRIRVHTFGDQQAAINSAAPDGTGFFGGGTSSYLFNTVSVMRIHFDITGSRVRLYANDDSSPQINHVEGSGMTNIDEYLTIGQIGEFNFYRIELDDYGGDEGEARAAELLSEFATLIGT